MPNLHTDPQRIRVLHVAQSVAGGIASYFEEIAEYQTDRFGSANVAFVVPAGTDHLPRLSSEQRICFRSASRRPAALLDFALTANAAIRRLQPEIVHVHSSFAGAVVRTVVAARYRRPRLIYCPHGWAFGMETQPAKQNAYAYVERRLAAITDLIYVNSQSEYELAARFGLPTELMRVIPNGIAWGPARQRAVKTGPLRVAFIGRHDRQKGLDILLDTIRHFPLPHIQFDIVGGGILSQGIARREIAVPNVKFHGWLSRRETLDILGSADTVIMPSRWEAFGLVAIEAMRAGVPVIASNRGALPEVVEHGCSGYIFDLDDPNSLGRLLNSLKRQELDRLGRAARERWERNYTSKGMNEQISAAYEHVLLTADRTGSDRAAAAAPVGACGRLPG